MATAQNNHGIKAAQRYIVYKSSNSTSFRNICLLGSFWSYYFNCCTQSNGWSFFFSRFLLSFTLFFCKLFLFQVNGNCVIQFQCYVVSCWLFFSSSLSLCLSPVCQRSRNSMKWNWIVAACELTSSLLLMIPPGASK